MDRTGTEYLLIQRCELRSQPTRSSGTERSSSSPARCFDVMGLCFVDCSSGNRSMFHGTNLAASFDAWKRVGRFGADTLLAVLAGNNLLCRRRSALFEPCEKLLLKGRLWR